MWPLIYNQGKRSLSAKKNYAAISSLHIRKTIRLCCIHTAYEMFFSTSSTFYTISPKMSDRLFKSYNGMILKSIVFCVYLLKGNIYQPTINCKDDQYFKTFNLRSMSGHDEISPWPSHYTMTFTLWYLKG